MNKIITRLKRYSCLLLCLCLLMPLLQGTAAAVQDSSVVRVAWYPDSAYNITCENGERSGYGYEYQQSVAAYTGWTYHYIEANWPDSLNMLQKDESTDGRRILRRGPCPDHAVFRSADGRGKNITCMQISPLPTFPYPI